MTKEEAKQRRREEYAWLKSKGFCTNCRHKKAVSGYVVCEECREKSRIKSALRRLNETPEQKEARKQYMHECREKAVSLGICAQCQKNPAQENRRLCSSCLEKSRRNTAKCRKKAET